MAAAVTAVESLPLDERDALANSGPAALADAQTEKQRVFNEGHTRLADGTFIPNEALATFPPAAQAALKTQGAGAIQGIGDLRPQPRFLRLQQLGFIPPDAEFAGVDDKGQVQFSGPPVDLGELTNGQVRALYASTFPGQPPPSHPEQGIPQAPDGQQRPTPGFTDVELMRDALKDRQATTPLSLRTLGIIGLSLIPVYGTARFWNDMSPAWRSVSVAADVLFVLGPVRTLKALRAAAEGLDTSGLTKVSRLADEQIAEWDKALTMAARTDGELAPLIEQGRAYAQAHGAYARELVNVAGLERKAARAAARANPPTTPADATVARLLGEEIRPRSMFATPTDDALRELAEKTLAIGRDRLAAAEGAAVEAVNEYLRTAKRLGIPVVSPRASDIFVRPLPVAGGKGAILHPPLPEDLSEAVLAQTRRVVAEATSASPKTAAAIEARLTKLGAELQQPNLTIAKRRVLNIEIGELKERLVASRLGRVEDLRASIRALDEDFIALYKGNVARFSPASREGISNAAKLQAAQRQRAVLAARLRQVIEGFEGGVIEARRPPFVGGPPSTRPLVPLKPLDALALRRMGSTAKPALTESLVRPATGVAARSAAPESLTVVGSPLTVETRPEVAPAPAPVIDPGPETLPVGPEVAPEDEPETRPVVAPVPEPVTTPEAAPGATPETAPVVTPTPVETPAAPVPAEVPAVAPAVMPVIDPATTPIAEPAQPPGAPAPAPVIVAAPAVAPVPAPVIDPTPVPEVAPAVEPVVKAETKTVTTTPRPEKPPPARPAKPPKLRVPRRRDATEDTMRRRPREVSRAVATFPELVAWRSGFGFRTLDLDTGETTFSEDPPPGMDSLAAGPGSAGETFTILRQDDDPPSQRDLDLGIVTATIDRSGPRFRRRRRRKGATGR